MMRLPPKDGVELNADGQPCDADPQWIWLCLFLDLVVPVVADLSGYKPTTATTVAYLIIFGLPQCLYMTRLPSRYLLRMMGLSFGVLVGHAIKVWLIS